VFYNEKKEDEMELKRNQMKNRESLTKTLMHNNNCDERLKLKLPPKLPPATPIKIQVTSEKEPSNKSFQFYSDTWRIFINGEIVPRKKFVGYKPISITKYNNIR
jgi:hypothetical protein